ncbi:flagellar brake protein [Noviherbaspirillum sp.]|uniref:flagellar brake protein n=1 Tax=Noviherbaspirillum sp. TaxID=1926288 RepID=UPI002FE12445
MNRNVTEDGQRGRATDDAGKAPGGAAEPEAKSTIVNLADNEWQIGQTLFLQHDTTRHLVKLIGFTEGKSVLVSAPMADGRYQLVRDGQVFVVRTFSGRKAYAFSSSVLKTVHVPYPYLHLGYPKQVTCAVVRRGARLDVTIVAAVSVIGTDHTAAVVLKDISLGGAAGTMKVLMGVPGEVFRLKFKVRVADEDLFLDIPVTLRSVQRDDGTDSYRHGFEFGKLDVRDKLCLGAFLHEARSAKE